MKERSHVGRWRKPAAEQRFRKVEDELWAEAFADPPPGVEVEVDAGVTHVYCWPGQGEPIVFLHGMGATSIMWWEYAGRLQGRPVYAIDTIGDVGRSEQSEPLQDAAAAAQWLDQTLAGIGVDRVHLVGASFGGWLSVNQAVRSPGRLASLTLLDPVGLDEFRMGPFMAWGFAVMAASYAPGPIRRRAAEPMHMPALVDKRVMEMVRRGQLTHRPGLPQPTLFTDEELDRIATPALVLLGEKSPIHHAHHAADRARFLMRDATAEIIADAGHALPISHVDLVIARMGTFLRKIEGASNEG